MNQSRESERGLVLYTDQREQRRLSITVSFSLGRGLRWSNLRVPGFPPGVSGKRKTFDDRSCAPSFPHVRREAAGEEHTALCGVEPGCALHSLSRQLDSVRSMTALREWAWADILDQTKSNEAKVMGDGDIGRVTALESGRDPGKGRERDRVTQRVGGGGNLRTLAAS